MIQQSEAQAPGKARDLVARARSEITDEALRVDLVELIETVMIYKLAHLSREEIQAMLQVHDIRQTRVYQEAKEEGLEEGLAKGRQEGLALAIQKMAAKKMPAQDIAALLEVDLELVKQVLSARSDG